MTADPKPGRLGWQIARVVEVVEETPDTSDLVLELQAWPGHLPGQHVDIRLNAADGYQAQRSYSIASAPDDGYLVLTVQRLDNGEVSPYLVDELQVDDHLELRGPIGGYFVWDAAPGPPVLLVAGGSGIVPFRAMLRHRASTESETECRLLYSSRSLETLIYREELLRLSAYDEVDVRFSLTRNWPGDWHGYRGRIDPNILGDAAWPPERNAVTFVCGPSGFVEHIAQTLVVLGHESGSIKTERFGPTG